MSTRSRSSGRNSSEVDDAIVRSGYGHILFRDEEQKLKFASMMKRPVTATRFLDIDTLRVLGLKDDLKKMLKRSGCTGLFKMTEHTYRCLTLEFLSSFFYDEEEPAVNFRLFNQEQCYYMEDWGNLLGCRWEGVTSNTEPRDGTTALWTALTGQERGGPGWKFRCHQIQHPVIRLWCRLIGNTYFARPEPTNMNRQETHILFSYLNIDGGDRFTVNIAHFVAKHMELVADGGITPIMFGGVITHIAKAIFGNIEETELELVAGDPSGAPLSMNIANLSRLHYIKAIDGRSWWWKVGSKSLVQLPERGNDRLVTPVGYFEAGLDPYQMRNHYLLDPPAPPSPSAPMSDDEEAQGGVPIIPPMGDYSRYKHHPFQQGDYQPEGFDLQQFPPTFATYPPFAYPNTWNQSSRDSVMQGLCDRVHQMGLNQNILGHQLWSSQMDQGHVSEGTVNPQFYAPQSFSDSEPSGSAAPSVAQSSGHSLFDTDQQGFVTNQQGYFTDRQPYYTDRPGPYADPAGSSSAAMSSFWEPAADAVQDSGSPTS